MMMHALALFFRSGASQILSLRLIKQHGYRKSPKWASFPQNRVKMTFSKLLERYRCLYNTMSYSILSGKHPEAERRAAEPSRE